VRATRALTQAGPSCREALQQFLAAHRDLAEGPRKRVEEVLLAVQIPPLIGLDGPTLAHHLMFGTPDEVIAKLRPYETLGVDQFTYYASLGLGMKEQKRSLELFCKEVIPAFN
jgi:alkanesulfonate monooxygenase SsuD/methylene tetrahydromethanopterin reductase-like flavin-dependent oxidoreductase (luciferase family)